MLGAGCAASSDTNQPAMIARFASFDVSADRPQRILVALLAADLNGVAFGTVRFSFAFIGTRAQVTPKPVAGPVTTADFRPLPGQSVEISTSGPDASCQWRPPGSMEPTGCDWSGLGSGR